MALDEKNLFKFFRSSDSEVPKKFERTDPTIHINPSKMFCTQVTPEQMKEQSRQATEAGMREVVNAIIEKESDPLTQSDSDSSDHYHKRHRNSRKRSRRERSDDPKIGRLETRNRYMQLEVANAMTTVQELEKKIDEMNAKAQPYIKVNNEFASIHSVRDNSFKKMNGFTTSQMVRKIRLFDEEFKEHIALCSAAISQIELHEVKCCLERVLASETRRAQKRIKEMERVLFVKQVRGGGLFIVILCIIARFLLLWF